MTNSTETDTSQKTQT